MKKIFLGLSLLLPTTLLAGESGISQLTPNWTGFYIGANLGGIWSNAHGSVADAAYYDHNGLFFPSFAQPYNANPNSFAGGVQIGYLNQMNHFIYGTEFSFLGLNSKDSHTLQAGEVGQFINIFKPGDSFSSQSTWQTAWVARLGSQLNNWMVYGVGGVAFMNSKIAAHITSFVDEDTNLFPASEGSDERTLVGGTVGLGVEYAWLPNLKMGLEYRYTDFGNHKYSVGQNAVSTLPNGFIYTALRANSKLETNLALLKLNYYFNNA